MSWSNTATRTRGLRAAVAATALVAALAAGPRPAAAFPLMVPRASLGLPEAGTVKTGHVAQTLRASLMCLAPRPALP